MRGAWYAQGRVVEGDRTEERAETAKTAVGSTSADTGSGQHRQCALLFISSGLPQCCLLFIRHSNTRPTQAADSRPSAADRPDQVVMLAWGVSLCCTPCIISLRRRLRCTAALVQHAVWCMMVDLVGWCKEGAKLRPTTMCSNAVNSDDRKSGTVGHHSSHPRRVDDEVAGSSHSVLIPHGPY